jgi:pyruvate ferredoxin oxidoreductase gamma subunit
MEQLTEIRWHGRGGQGVVTAGKVLAETALGADLFFQAFPDFGPERAGAPIRAFTRLSNRPISVHSAIEAPDVVVVLDATVMSAVDVTEGLKPDGVVIVNTAQSPDALRVQLGLQGRRVFTVDASHIAIEELGRELTNTPMLGALAQATGIFPVATVAEQIRQSFQKKLRPEVVEANVRAVERAAAEIAEG